MDINRVTKHKIKTIILAGCRDFGRCPIASRLPTALWPVISRPVLENLLLHLSSQGIKQVTICSNGDSKLLQQNIHLNGTIDIEYLDEPLAKGTAGCISSVVRSETKSSVSCKEELILILPACLVNPPKIDTLLKTHHDSKSDLTVMFNPSHKDGKSLGEPADIYICETNILEHIPKEGYYDIKEGLIPEMLQSGKTVHAAILPHYVGNFRNRQGYLYATNNYLENTSKPNDDLKLCKRTDSHTLWMAADTKVDPSVRFYGEVAIMNGACISKGAVIFGPTILGRNVSVGRDAFVANSVLWDGAEVNSNCDVQRCLIDYNAIVKKNTIVEEKSIPFKRVGILATPVKTSSTAIKNSLIKIQQALQHQSSKINAKLPNWIQLHKANISNWLMACLVIIAFLWSYWPGLTKLWHTWQRSDEYSSGLLVPFLAVYVLWSKRHNFKAVQIKPSIWGLLAFVLAQGIRTYYGLYLGYGSADRFSIVLSIASLVLFMFGWKVFKKVSTVLLFLCLMLPWPNRIQAAVSLPLQRLATSSAVFCLEMTGYEIIQEGNVIHIGNATIAVAEACNGLRMITAFFVISGLVILLVKRSFFEKLIVLASSLPIALLCNTVRLTITAVAFTMLSGEHWEHIFHDFGGYAMMPLALAAVVTELWLFTKLTALPTKQEAIIIKRR